jgi:hypothetical protein
MRRTLIGVFDRDDTARAAQKALEEAGFGTDRVRVTAAAVDLPAGSGVEPDDGVAAHLRSFFAELFGPGHGHPIEDYAHAVRGGGALLHVGADDDRQFETAKTVLQRAGAVSLDERPRSPSGA